MNAKVKICGITRAEDAEAAVELGASAVGFIFVNNSPRYLDPERAKKIIQRLPPFVTPVGVVLHVSRPEALALVANSGVRCLQVHENEHAPEIADLPVPSYTVFRVSSRFQVDVLRGLKAGTFMLDTYIDGTLGGTGKTFDWNVAVEAKQYGRLILSGGLKPENVGDAIRTVRPYAVDVSSGIERSPGVKDYKKMEAFFKAVVDAAIQAH